MRILIIEDEEHNSRMLQGMIAEIRPEWEVVERLKSVRKSVEWLSTNTTPDLIFLDIQLSDGICFSIFEQVKVDAMIVFTTAYDEYAIRAFDVNSIDYLLKPIKETKLENAIIKFENWHQNEAQSPEKLDYDELRQVILKGEKKYRTKILVNSAAYFYKINVDEVAYFYTEQKICFAVGFDRKEHIVDFTIEKLESQLNPEQFFRANRGIIINAEAIHNFESYFGSKLFVRLIKPLDKEVIISRLKATEFKIWMGK